jgi:hypothetical protein
MTPRPAPQEASQLVDTDGNRSIGPSQSASSDSAVEVLACICNEQRPQNGGDGDDPPSADYERR